MTSLEDIFRKRLEENNFKSYAREVADDIYNTEGTSDTRGINAFMAEALNAVLKPNIEILESYDQVFSSKLGFKTTQHNERVVFNDGIDRGSVRVGDFSQELGAEFGFNHADWDNKREYKNEWREQAFSKVIETAKQWQTKIDDLEMDLYQRSTEV